MKYVLFLFDVFEISEYNIWVILVPWEIVYITEKIVSE